MFSTLSSGQNLSSYNLMVDLFEGCSVLQCRLTSLLTGAFLTSVFPFHQVERHMSRAEIQSDNGSWKPAIGCQFHASSITCDLVWMSLHSTTCWQSNFDTFLFEPSCLSRFCLPLSGEFVRLKQNQSARHRSSLGKPHPYRSTR